VSGIGSPTLIHKSRALVSRLAVAEGIVASRLVLIGAVVGMPPLDAIHRPPDLRPQVVAPGSRIVVPPPLPERLHNTIAWDALMETRVISSKAMISIHTPRGHSGGQAVARCTAPNPRLVAPRPRILLPPPLLELALNAVRRHVGAQSMVIDPWPRDIVRAGRAAALRDVVAWDAVMEMRIIGAGAWEGLSGGGAGAHGNGVCGCA
jgi:hypothetical protein